MPSPQILELDATDKGREKGISWQTVNGREEGAWTPACEELVRCSPVSEEEWTRGQATQGVVGAVMSSVLCWGRTDARETWEPMSVCVCVCVCGEGQEVAQEDPVVGRGCCRPLSWEAALGGLSQVAAGCSLWLELVGLVRPWSTGKELNGGGAAGEKVGVGRGPGTCR